MRKIFARLLSWLAVIASGGVTMSCPAYGVFEPSIDPEVEITDFSYTPAEAITPGSDVVFRAVVNQAPGGEYTQDMRLLLRMTGDVPGSGWDEFVEMRDDGYDPDAYGGDLVFTGEWEVDDDCAPGLVVIRSRYGQGEGAEFVTNLYVTEDD